MVITYLTHKRERVDNEVCIPICSSLATFSLIGWQL